MLEFWEEPETLWRSRVQRKQQQRRQEQLHFWLLIGSVFCIGVVSILILYVVDSFFPTFWAPVKQWVDLLQSSPLN